MGDAVETMTKSDASCCGRIWANELLGVGGERANGGTVVTNGGERQPERTALGVGVANWRVAGHGGKTARALVKIWRALYAACEQRCRGIAGVSGACSGSVCPDGVVA